MKNIVILGCENSHANSFLKFIKENPRYAGVNVLGVYSSETEASEKLAEQFGVSVMDEYDALAGKVDGVIVTARHGDNHFKYVRPYIRKGISVFIDKPVTVSESEANEMMRLFIKNDVKFTGGSCCVYAPLIEELSSVVKNEEKGVVYGGFMRAPVSMENAYGGFFFYAQHLVEVTCKVFGYFPNSVIAFRKGNAVSVTVRYDRYDVNLEFVDGVYDYYAYVSSEKDVVGGKYEVDTACFETEFEHFYHLLSGGEQEKDAKEFIAPVFILNAIYRSLESGKEETVVKSEEF